LGPPVTQLSIATQAQIVPRQKTKKTPFDAITSSTPIHSHGGGKSRTGTSTSAEPKVLQEEEERDALLTAVEPFKLAGNVPSFDLLAPPLSTPPLVNASKTPDVLTTQLPPSPKASISTEQAIASTSASPTLTTRLNPPPLMTESPSSSTPQSFNISPPQSVTRDSTEAEERPTAVLKPDVEPVASKSVPISHSEINTVGEPSRSEEESKRTPQATEPSHPCVPILKDKEAVAPESKRKIKRPWNRAKPPVTSESSAPKQALQPGATVQPSATDDKEPVKGALTGYTSPSNQPPLSFSDPQEESNKSSEEPKRQLLSESTSGSPFASTSLATGGNSAASTISVRNDLLISEEFPSGQESSVQPSTLLPTGSLFSFIGKKPEAAEVSYAGFPPVSASSASTNVTSASTFTAVGYQPKSTLSVPILPTTTAAAPSPFGSFTPTPHPSGGQAPVTTSTTTILQPSTAPETLHFGPPIPVAAAVPFTSNSAAPSSLFGFGATSANRALTTTTSSNSSSGLISFLPTTSTAPTSSATQSSCSFSFGNSTNLSNAKTFDEFSESAKQPTFGYPPSISIGSTRTDAFGVPSTTPSAFFGAPTAPPQGRTAFNAVSNFGVYPLGSTPAANASFGLKCNSSSASTSSGPPPDSNSFGGVAPSAASSTGFSGVNPLGNAQAANTGYPFYPNSSFISSPSGPPPNSNSFCGAASVAAGSTGFGGVQSFGNESQAAKPGFPFNLNSSFASTRSGPPPNTNSFGGAALVAAGSTGFGGVQSFGNESQAANTRFPFNLNSSFASTPTGPPPNTNSFGGAAPLAAGSTGFGGVHSIGNPSQAANAGYTFNPNTSFASTPSGSQPNSNSFGGAAPVTAGSTGFGGVHSFGSTPQPANTGFTFNLNSSYVPTPSGPPPNSNSFGGAAPVAAGSTGFGGVNQFENAQAANSGFPFYPNSSYVSTPSGPPPNSNSFGGAAPVTAGSTGFGGVQSFGSTPQPANTGFTFGGAAPVAAGSTGFGGVNSFENAQAANSGFPFYPNSSFISSPSGPPPNSNTFGGEASVAAGSTGFGGVPQFESTQTANMGVPFSPNSSLASAPSGPPPGGESISTRRTLKAIRRCVQQQPN